MIPFFSFSPETRRIIYTTNAIESLNMQLRKVIKIRGHFPSDEAAMKLIYLAFQNIVRKWKNPSLTWRSAISGHAVRHPVRIEIFF